MPSLCNAQLLFEIDFGAVGILPLAAYNGTVAAPSEHSAWAGLGLAVASPPLCFQYKLFNLCAPYPGPHHHQHATQSLPRLVAKSTVGSTAKIVATMLARSPAQTREHPARTDAGNNGARGSESPTNLAVKFRLLGLFSTRDGADFSVFLSLKHARRTWRQCWPATSKKVPYPELISVFLLSRRQHLNVRCCGRCGLP